MCCMQITAVKYKSMGNCAIYVDQSVRIRYVVTDREWLWLSQSYTFVAIGRLFLCHFGPAYCALQMQNFIMEHTLSS